MTTTSPIHAKAWHAATVERNVSINAVACPSVSFCLVGDDAGRTEISTSPTAGATSWTPQTAAAKDRIETLACPSARLCLAGTRKGHVVVGSR